MAWHRRELMETQTVRMTVGVTFHIMPINATRINATVSQTDNHVFFGIYLQFNAVYQTQQIQNCLAKVDVIRVVGAFEEAWDCLLNP